MKHSKIIVKLNGFRIRPFFFFFFSSSKASSESKLITPVLEQAHINLSMVLIHKRRSALEL